MSLLVENDETLISNVTDLSGMESAFLGEHCFCIGVSGVGIMGIGFCTEITAKRTNFASSMNSPMSFPAYNFVQLSH